MKVIFIIPADRTISGRAEVATYQGRYLIATTAEETREVPDWWDGVDLDVDTITVAEWLETLRG